MDDTRAIMGHNIKFTHEEMDNFLAFLDTKGKYGRSQTHTDLHIVFDSHHHLHNELGLIRTLNHRFENVPTKDKGKLKKKQHIRTALKTRGYPNWAFFKNKNTKKNKTNGKILFGAVSEKKVIITFMFFFQAWQHSETEGKTLRQKHSNVVYAVQCSEECMDFYI